MAYYQTCPECGAHLDPGESCDCEKEEGETGMTLEEIESMELTYELIEQAQQKATPENIARITLLTARMLLDYCDGDREMAKEQVQRDYEGQTSIHGANPSLLRLLLKSIDALADFRAKKQPTPKPTKAKG